MKNLFALSLAISCTILCAAQNVGIGTTTPAHKLDLAGGRMRIQHSAAGTAGIWFDGPSFLHRSFFGTMNDSHAGIFGSGGTGWNFVMNTNNGNTGIGTTAPTARLDINGTLRIRQNGATAGSTLHAVDAQGNTEWFAPVAFKVLGYSAGGDILFPTNTWQDINFGSNISYNHGNGYSPATSEFVAPQKGLYNLKSKLTFLSQTYGVRQRLKLRRNGVVSTIEQSVNNPLDEALSHYTILLDTDYMLEAGDAVWVEAFAVDVNSSQIIVSDATDYTWFSGRLITPF